MVVTKSSIKKCKLVFDGGDMKSSTKKILSEDITVSDTLPQVKMLDTTKLFTTAVEPFDSGGRWSYISVKLNTGRCF